MIKRFSKILKSKKLISAVVDSAIYDWIGHSIEDKFIRTLSSIIEGTLAASAAMT